VTNKIVDTTQEDKSREAWNKRMLPMMSRMILGLTIFFFLSSAAQLAYLHIEISNSPEGDFETSQQMLRSPQITGNEQLALPAAAITTLSALERNAMERRYHQANVSLMSRVWTRYLGFVTGMVLAMAGAVFILGRLQTASSTASAKTAGGEFSFKSESPGLVLVGLGVVLMTTTIVTHHEIKVDDRAIYANGWSIASPTQQPADGEVTDPVTLNPGTTEQGENVEASDDLAGVLDELNQDLEHENDQ